MAIALHPYDRQVLPRAPGATARRARRPWGAVRTALGLWRERRRQRLVLEQLTDRDLADFGMSRFAAAREAAKPFWRA